MIVSDGSQLWMTGTAVFAVAGVLAMVAFAAGFFVGYALAPGDDSCEKGAHDR